MKKIILLVLFALSLGGCGTGLIQSLVDSPEIKTIALKTFSIKDKRAVFEVALYNPNAYSLPMTGLVGDISLNGVAIGHVDVQSDEGLPAQITKTVDVPISLDSEKLTGAVKKVLSLRQAKYQFNGDVITSVADIPFSKEGDLPMKDIIRALFKIRF